MSVVEFARQTSQPGKGDLYEEALRSAVDLFLEDPNCPRMAVYRCIEDPDSFVLEIEWTSVEAHLNFRNTPQFAQYRSLINDLLGPRPEGAHYNQVVSKRSSGA